MILRLRSYLAIALVLSIVLTGFGAAQMRAMTTPAGQIVLCTGTGPVTVYVDKDGQPTTPPHHCPDCLMQLLTALVGPEHPVLRGPGPAIGPRMGADAVVSLQNLLRASARAPPVSV